jgi:hypothetical protein
MYGLRGNLFPTLEPDLDNTSVGRSWLGPCTRYNPFLARVMLIFYDCVSIVWKII